MRIYRPKKLIPGYKVDPNFKGKELIAVPEERIKEGVIVIYEGGKMFLNINSIPLKRLEFEDKFGRNKKYRLWYFEWKPVIEQVSILKNFEVMKNLFSRQGMVIKS